MIHISTVEPKIIGAKTNRIMFPGKSSFPLSPCSKNQEDLTKKVVSKLDQMQLVMNFIGVPSK
jgi:hypothetical protein